MPRRADNRPFRSGRGVALAVAVLLLAAQSIATAHIHFKDLRAGAERTRVAETFCPLCLFHFHSPKNPGTSPILVRPAAVQRQSAAQTGARLFIVSVSLLFSRAPPAPL